MKSRSTKLCRRRCRILLNMSVREELATSLWHARTKGGVVARSEAGGLDSTDAAYNVQREIEALAAMPRYGWKVGATSKAAQQVLDIYEPVTAPMFAPFCFQSPAEVAVFGGQGASVESEFAFHFTRDLPRRQELYSLDEVLSAVDAMFPAVEIVGSRFEGGLEHIGTVLLVADMVAHTAFVTGSRVVDWRKLDLQSHLVRLIRNGQNVSEGFGANVGNPLHVLEWTANHLLRRGEAIAAGDIVTTGTCTGITPVAPGDSVVADFGTLGRVELRLVEA